MFVDDVLCRTWSPRYKDEEEWKRVLQVVVPGYYRQHILALAHDHSLSAHLCMTKTHDRILRHFFWPGLKSDVVAYCRSCLTCQVVGKPNQVIPSAPLQPVIAIDEPFEHVVVHNVGPLPKTRNGNQFLLTILGAATRYPEALPLRKNHCSCCCKGFSKFFFYFRVT